MADGSQRGWTRSLWRGRSSRWRRLVVVSLSAAVLTVSAVVVTALTGTGDGGACETSAQPGLALAAHVVTVAPTRAGAGPSATATESSDPTRKSVPVGTPAYRSPQRSDTDGAGITSVDRKDLPRPAAATVPVSGAETKVGDLPVALTAASSSAPKSMRVEVLDEKARKSVGVSAALLALSCADGPAGPGQVHLRVYYWDFGNAYGGDYANRVQLVQLPACALTTPGEPECRDRTNLRAARKAGALSADITVAGGGSVTLVAVT